MKFDYKILQIKKKNGDFVFVKPVPITRLIEFSWKIQSILTILKELNISLIQAWEITELKDIKILAKECFEFSNLDINDYSLDIINELICENGILQTINNLNQKNETEPAIKTPIDNNKNVSLFEFVSRTVTLLVHLELALDLKEAWLIADSFPHDQLESMINSRILQVDPDYEKRAKKESTQKELMNELVEDIKKGFIPSQDSTIQKPKFIFND